MVSLFGWDFVLPVRRRDLALPIFAINSRPQHVARGVVVFATAFFQALRNCDTLITSSRQLSVEFGAGHPVLPARA